MSLLYAVIWICLEKHQLTSGHLWIDVTLSPLSCSDDLLALVLSFLSISSKFTELIVIFWHSLFSPKILPIHCHLRRFVSHALFTKTVAILKKIQRL